MVLLQCVAVQEASPHGGARVGAGGGGSEGILKPGSTGLQILQEDGMNFECGFVPRSWEVYFAHCFSSLLVVI